MRRKFNYTNRKRIRRESVAISLNKSADQQLSCNVDLILDGYGLPPDTKLYLEVFDRFDGYNRTDLGTVSSFEPREIKIEGFRSESTQFRLKAVDEKQKQGRILAAIDGIVAKEPMKPDSIIGFYCRDLGELPYEIDCSGEHSPFPVLWINSQLQDIAKYMIKDPLFRGLVFPAIVRELLFQILLVDEIYDTEGDEWQNKWLRHIVEICEVEDPPADLDDPNYQEDCLAWINKKAISAFCSRNDLLERFGPRYRGVEERDGRTPFFHE